MNVWEKFKSWFRSDDPQKKVTVSSNEKEMAAVEENTLSTKKDTIMAADMINSIMIDTEMETLYLIDNKRAIPYD